MFADASLNAMAIDSTTFIANVAQVTSNAKRPRQRYLSNPPLLAHPSLSLTPSFFCFFPNPFPLPHFPLLFLPLLRPAAAPSTPTPATPLPSPPARPSPSSPTACRGPHRGPG